MKHGVHPVDGTEGVVHYGIRVVMEWLQEASVSAVSRLMGVS